MSTAIPSEEILDEPGDASAAEPETAEPETAEPETTAPTPGGANADTDTATDADTASDVLPARWFTLPQGWRSSHAVTFALPIVGLVLAIKAMIYTLGISVQEIISNVHFTSAAGRFDFWNAWDAPNYLSLAEHGYQTSGDPALLVVFFPGYPWAVRVFSYLDGGNYLLSAFLVSGLASIAAALLLGYLVRKDTGDEGNAQRAVWFLLIFPTSYFLHLPYTESFFLAFVLGSFLAARSGEWALAGLLGAVASLSRVNGLVLVPALILEAYSQYRAGARPNYRWLWIGLTAAGFGIYLLVNWHVYGSPTHFLQVQREHWFKQFEWPWAGIKAKYDALAGSSPRDRQMVVLQELLYLALGAGGAIAAWVWLRPSYAIWMTGNWLLFASTSFILSTPRYTLTLFPLFILAAKVTRHRMVNYALSAWSLSFLCLFTTAFVAGFWAF